MDGRTAGDVASPQLRCSALRKHVLALSGPVFAVLDGAQFENLPDDLLAAGLIAHGLYRDRGSDGSLEYERTMPRMIALDGATGRAQTSRRAAVDRLLNFVVDRATAVFWECPGGPDVLVRHLRSINMVLFPRNDEAASQRTAHDREENGNDGGWYGADERDASAGEQGDATEPYEMVVFRHADTDVLAQVLPALDEHQFARLLGPASSVLFRSGSAWCDSSNGLVLGRRTAGATQPPGPLRIDDDTKARIEDLRLVGGTVAFLRDTNPELTQRLEAEHLRTLVHHWTRDGQARGMRSERAMWKWSYLNLVTGGTIGERSDMRSYLTSDDPTRAVDERVDALMAGAIEELEQAVR